MNRLYNIIFKIFVVVIILILIIFATSSSYSSESIDKLAYVVALALDTGSDNNIKLTIQLANPNSYSSETSSQSSASVLTSVECSSIESGVNLLNSYISRNINLSHCKAIIISEELAIKGITKYMYDLCNNVEVSSHANIIITKCTALEYLKMSNPILESFSARYYQIAPTSSKYTGYTNSIPLIDFFNSVLDTFKQPVATLGNINVESTHLNVSDTDITNKDSSYVAGQTPITSSNNVESMGIAVFRSGTLVGELNGLESICHMIVSGELKYCNVQIEDPQGHEEDIDLNIKLSGKPKCSVKFVNGFPYVDINVKLNVRVLTIDQDCDYSDKKVVQDLENEVNEYFEKIILDYLYKTSKEFNSDIDGFGKYAVKYFSTTEEWNNYKWLDNYKNCFFNIKVNSKIKSGYSFISV